MSRIARTFERLRAEGRTGLVTFVTSGDPDMERSAAVLLALDRAGADVLEIGVPFSDPVADGPVIQRASERALRAGTTLGSTMATIGRLRSSLHAPVVLFTYANPLLRMGLREFTRQAAQAGVDGLLMVDLPIEESAEVTGAVTAAGIDPIFLVSPTTSDERLQRTAEAGRGFLYGISRLGVTGARGELSTEARELGARVRRMSSLPLAIGFGISRPEHVREVGAFADAAVVGSALVALLADPSDARPLPERATAYVRWLRTADPAPAVRQEA